jgi:hypothetical protein
MCPARIKAYTIVELTVAMLVSVVLLGIGFYSLQILQANYLRFSEKAEKMVELTTLQGLLQRDFKRSEVIKAEGNFLFCVSDSLTIIYQIVDTILIRQQLERQDTFSIGLLEPPRFFFRGRELDANQEMVDMLSFTAHYEGEAFLFLVRKEYDAATLLKAGF